MRRLALLALIPILGLSAPPPAQAQLLDFLTAPKTLFDRAIEARSFSDILEDNRIVAAVNGIMVDLGTIQASTEIYEQRLLITGLFNDKKLYDKFFADVKKITGVKKLYWHVTHMTEKEQKRREKKKELLKWVDALALDVSVGLNLVGTLDVADVNFKVAADAYSNVYLMGRARSRPEMDKAVKVARETEGVKKLYNYAIVRP
ncbi:MAG: BON domain-containing protein [Alphaproteobacteria bacterium]|nr:BON domain-containing protein [Alphaproteobacteria bacterium]